MDFSSGDYHRRVSHVCGECNISLLVENTTLDICKKKLRKYSGYFEALFISGMSECEKSEIALHGISFGDVKLLVDFLNKPWTIHVYSDEELNNVLRIASYFDVEEMMEPCELYIWDNLNKFNCVEYYELLWKYIPDKRNILKDVEAVMAENFSEFKENPQLHDLDRQYVLPLIEKLLESSDLIYTKESEILDFCNNLIDRSSSKDQQLKVIRLLNKIRFPLIPVKKLEEFREQRYTLLQNMEKSLADHLDEVIHQVASGKPLDPKLCNVRCIRPVGVVIGGLRRKESSSRLFVPTNTFSLACCTEETYPSINLIAAPEHKLPVSMYEHSACVVDNVLYVAGGQRKKGPNSLTNIGNRAFCYDFRNENWAELPPMLEERAQFFLAGVGSCLYAIGGVNWVGEMTSVEFLSGNADSWQLAASLPFNLHGHAGAVLNGKIYISGGTYVPRFELGLNPPVPRISAKFLCYDPITNVWELRKDMKKGRTCHSMFVLNGKLYVFGGTFNGALQAVTDQSDCECYDPELDEWTSVHIPGSPALFPASGCCILNNVIACFGSYTFGASPKNQDNVIWLLHELEDHPYWRKPRPSDSTSNLIRYHPCCATVLPGPSLAQLAFKKY